MWVWAELAHCGASIGVFIMSVGIVMDVDSDLRILSFF
jgi:hypothetical protein